VGDPLKEHRAIDARWHSDDTDPAHVADALRKLETTRTRDGATVAPARALTLIVLISPEHDDDVHTQLLALGTNRASRTIIIREHPDRTAMEARAAVISDDKIGDELRESIVLDVGPHDVADLVGIVDPLTVSDVPTVAWAPYGDAKRFTVLSSLCQNVLLDGDLAPSLHVAIGDALTLRNAGVRPIDMAWLRSAPWRVRLAALSQPPVARAQLSQIASVEVATRPDSRACGAMLAGWLSARLGWSLPYDKLIDASGEPVEISVVDAEQPLPGVAALCLNFRDGASRRLSRSPGGLLLEDTAPDGSVDRRHVMGASRGAGGLLSSGLRQVLLPDELDLEVLSASQQLSVGHAIAGVA
jgi:glucose-6-phosphate dehydrogenase assembly protein OpcA